METNKKVVEKELRGHIDVLNKLLNQYHEYNEQLMKLRERITMEKTVVETLTFALTSESSKGSEQQCPSIKQEQSV